MSESVPDLRSRYWAPVERNTTLTAELALIGADKKVLEIGPGSGHMTEALVRQNCVVTCVEVSRDLNSMAGAFCHQMIVGDIELLCQEEGFPGEKFDVILFGDVLEHLRDPAAVLGKLRDHLTATGYLVASVPNVAHASVRLALFNGEFNYNEEGLLDRTHLKFFTIDSLNALLRSAGFSIVELRRTRAGVFNTEVKLSIEKISAGLLRRLMRDAEATTYQFIFSAQPIADDGGSSRPGEAAAFIDNGWSARKGKTRLAKSMARRGRTLIQRGAPAQSRAWLSRSFQLQPRIPTLFYWFYSFMPRSK
ncbi:MAG: class I SAM-dependent methyltransferase [Deltaproteobacteria bacterium]|nr:class I SAM-dependent methyltransferase [Deltaproteobacteria bacterium]